MAIPQPSTNPFHSPFAGEATSRLGPADASPAAMSRLRAPFTTGPSSGDDRTRRGDWS